VGDTEANSLDNVSRGKLRFALGFADALFCSRYGVTASTAVAELVFAKPATADRIATLARAVPPAL